MLKAKYSSSDNIKRLSMSNDASTLNANPLDLPLIVESSNNPLTSIQCCLSSSEMSSAKDLTSSTHDL